MSDIEKRIQDGAAEIAQDEYHGQLYRNNSGTAFDPDTKRAVLFGLGHTSSKSIKDYTSSDQIGVIQVLITQEMVGKHIGVFAAFEDKRPGWVLSAKDRRGQAQLNFGNHIRRMNGIFGFITDPTHIRAHIQEYIKCLKNPRS